MPTKTLRAMAERAGVSIEEAEAAWEKAKEKVKKEYPGVEEGSESYWKLVTKITENMLGLKTERKRNESYMTNLRDGS